MANTSKFSSGKAVFQDRSRGFYLSLLSAALLAAAAVIYLVYALTVKHFVLPIFLVMLLGVLGEGLVLFGNFRHLQIVEALLAMLAFGMYLDDRLEMFVLMASGVYGMSESGAILGVVILILALLLISAILGIASCFTLPRKSMAEADSAAQKQYKAEKAAQKKRVMEEQDKALKNMSVPVTTRMLSAKSKLKVGVAAGVAVLVALACGLGIGYGMGGGSGETADQPAQRVAYGIMVSSMPLKTNYTEGEVFTSDGMAVTICYSDGSSNEVTGWYTNVDGKNLEVSDAEVTISYQDYQAKMNLHINEAATAGEFTGGSVKLKLKENGAVQQAGADQEEYKTVGTWKNAGSAVTAEINGAEYPLVHGADGSWTMEYGGETLKAASLHIIENFTFEGYSQYGDKAGAGQITLSADGKAGFSVHEMAMASGEWYKQGQSVIVTLNGTTVTGTGGQDGIYTLVYVFSASGYTLTYTTTCDVNAQPAPAQPSGTDEPEPSGDEPRMTLTAQGAGTAEGRTATLSMFDDGSLTLEWVYAAKNYVLDKYTGTWNQSGTAITLHINEKDGSVTDYPLSLTASEASFEWAKDNDRSDPDYVLTLSGPLPTGGGESTQPEPETVETFMTLEGEYGEGDSLRNVKLTLLDDNTLTLEWIYPSKNYVLDKYTGTWAADGTKLIVNIKEKSGATTSYELALDSSTYSQGYVTYNFTWEKDPDGGGEVYAVPISGQIEV